MNGFSLCFVSSNQNIGHCKNQAASTDIRTKPVTDDGTFTDQAFESMVEWLVDELGELVAQVAAQADEQQDCC